MFSRRRLESRNSDSSSPKLNRSSRAEYRSRKAMTGSRPPGVFVPRSASRSNARLDSSISSVKARKVLIARLPKPWPKRKSSCAVSSAISANVVLDCLRSSGNVVSSSATRLDTASSPIPTRLATWPVTSKSCRSPPPLAPVPTIRLRCVASKSRRTVDAPCIAVATPPIPSAILFQSLKMFVEALRIVRRSPPTCR